MAIRLSRYFQSVSVRAPRFLWWSLRPTVAGVFLLTTLFGPGSGWGQTRGGPLNGRGNQDEFATDSNDSAYFSPDRLRARISELDTMVSNQNSRFARMQGRSLKAGAEDLGPRVLQMALEKFQMAAQMNADVEMKRAQFSQKLASAGGFQYSTFADGKRMWFKAGKVHRIENERITDASGQVHIQDTTDMVYDDRGNLLSSKTETRDPDGLITVKRWEGTYSQIEGKDKLVGFKETTWDPLGNESHLERSALVWGGADDKNLLSYDETSIDSYGQKITRKTTDCSYDDKGNLLSFKETTQADGITSTRHWGGAVYEKFLKDGKDDWRLCSYTETSWDPAGRESKREWGRATFDEAGALKSYSEKTTRHDGRVENKTWGDAKYDRRGNLVSFREKVERPDGLVSMRVFNNGVYDVHGRRISYDEFTGDENGSGSTRHWRKGDYNSKGELLGYEEDVVGETGYSTRTAWRATAYEQGRLTGSQERITDDRDHITTKNWAGAYNPQGRLLSFEEETIDGQGNRNALARKEMGYDDVGRLTGYAEVSTDMFGGATKTTWAAEGFNKSDEVTSFRRTDTGIDGKTHTTHRDQIVYDARGRQVSYLDNLSVHGDGVPTLTATVSWQSRGYNRRGELVGFDQITTNARGETEAQGRDIFYDQRGRTERTNDTFTNSAGEIQTLGWQAKEFDEWDRATHYVQNAFVAGVAKEIDWRGTFNEKGLAISSQEVARDSFGLVVTSQLKDGVFDNRGRISDGTKTVMRSDSSGVVATTIMAGLRYDMDGQQIGGIETTVYSGSSPQGPVRLTSVRKIEGQENENGRAREIRKTTEMTGTIGGQSTHTKDTVTIVITGLNSRTESDLSEAFDSNGVELKSRANQSFKTNMVTDLSGRVLSYDERTTDSGAPDSSNIIHRENRYHGGGDLAGYTEESTDAHNVRTRTEVSRMATNAEGQTVQLKEVTTHPGLTVTTDETVKTALTYDYLGRATGSKESTLTTGPGLYSRSQSVNTTEYDAWGRVSRTTSEGDRNGLDFKTQTLNRLFDQKGRAIAYQTTSEGAAGVSRLAVSQGAFDSEGRLNRFHEEGFSNGGFSSARVTIEFDQKGRSFATTREGYDQQGDFTRREETTAYNNLGQAQAKKTVGWSASEGNTETVDKNLTYGITGEMESFDREKKSGSKSTLSHWQTLGRNERGLSLGYSETSSEFENGTLLHTSVSRHDATSYNSNGQETRSRTTTIKSHASGEVERTETAVSASYGKDGLQIESEEDQILSVTRGGETTTARSVRRRSDVDYYDADGDGHRRGLLKGYRDTVFDSSNPKEGTTTLTKKIAYGNNGVMLGGETTSAKVSRFSDALRRLADIFTGTNLAQAGGDLLAGLIRLIRSADNLLTEIQEWLSARIPGTDGKTVADRVGSWLTRFVQSDGEVGAFSEVRSLNYLQRALLAGAVYDDASGVRNSEIPLNLQPAAASLGVFDKGLTFSYSKDKTLDSLNRAEKWTEVTVSAASPDKPIETQVSVTYEGDSTRLASYHGRIVEGASPGAKVTHLYKYGYEYDALGRSTWSEATFEGDHLILSDPMTLGQSLGKATTTDVRSMDQPTWRGVLDSIYSGAVEVEGRVEFSFHDPVYDALGQIKDDLGIKETRGYQRTRLSDGALPPETLAAQRETLEASIDDVLAQEKEALEAERDFVDAEIGILDDSIERLNGFKSEEEDVLRPLQDARNIANRILTGEVNSIATGLGKAISDLNGISLKSSTLSTFRNYTSIKGNHKVPKNGEDVVQWRYVNSSGQVIEEKVKTTFKGDGLKWVVEKEEILSSKVLLSITVDDLESSLKQFKSLFPKSMVRNSSSSGYPNDKHRLKFVGKLDALVAQKEGLAALRKDLGIADNRVLDQAEIVGVLNSGIQQAQAVKQSKAAQRLTLKREIEQFDGRSLSVKTDRLNAGLLAIQKSGTELAKALSQQTLIRNGKTVRLTESEAYSLLETQNLNGESIEIKTDLRSTAQFAHFNVGESGTASIEISGAAKFNGQAVNLKDKTQADRIRSWLAENSSSQGPPSASGFSLVSDGRISLSLPVSQSQDTAGRLKSQSIKTIEMSRLDGRESTKTATVNTSQYSYDGRGNVTGYVRVTDDGHKKTTEKLVSAAYSAQGDQTGSVVHITDQAGGETETYTVESKAVDADANGHPTRWSRAQIRGDQVNITVDSGKSVVSRSGQVELSQADSIQTDLAAWKKAEGDFSLLQGNWSRTASWITAFGPMGEAVEGVRLTRENFKADLGPGGYHTRLESFKNEFDSSGKNIVKTTVTGSELGRSSVNGETALVSKFDQTVTTVLDGKFDVLGRALREKRVTTENGQTTTTEDIEDRQYGTHPRTHQNIVSSTGEMSTVLWEGVLNAAGQTVRFNRKTTRGSTVTEESSNENSRYEQGRLVYENTHTKETKSGLVTEWDSVEKTKEFDVFGRVSRAEVTTTRSTLLGRKVTTENRTYGYDAYGRLSSTDVIGTETVGGAVRQINTRQETLSFYADGRARKTRSISREGEVVTTRLTQGEIRYDKEGNVVESLEKVRQQGPHLDKTYTDGFTDARYDPQGRQIGVKQIRIDGSLKTERTVVNKKFNADNQAVEFDVTVSEMSLDSSLAHAKTYRESTTGATYDRFGNMQNYVKGDNADGIRKTRTPVAGFDQYDNQGRMLQSMVEVKDDLGKIHYELVFGVGFNSDGLQSSSVTVNFTTRQGSPSSEAVEALQRMYARGELSSESLNRDDGAQLGADLSPFVKARTEIQNVRDIYPWRGRVTSSVTKSVLVGGITNIEISTQPRLEYDRQGRVINAPGVSVSLAWDDNGVLIKHNATTMPENRTLMFDSLNRAVLTRKTTTSSAQTTTTTSILTYQPNGRLATQTDHISERGAINKTHSQLTTFTYDSWGRVTDQLTKSYHDSTSPDKVAYFRKIVSNFDPKGNALKYVTESWDNTSVDKERKEYSGARYDNAGNLIFVNRVKTFKEAPGGLRTLVSLDQHVVNTYTKKGELVKTEYTRYWGEELAKFADGGKYQTSNGGGGVDGLDEGWTSGNAKVSTRYEYDPSTGHMSAMHVTANGTGKHSNGEIQALGIQLTYSQTDIKYNNAGQVTGYHQVVKQIEHYCYYKQSQKGLKRKVKTVWTTGMLTTESDVQVLEYDSYGRQIHTVTTSQQNDPSQTWTRTESKIKSFDDHGGVKDVTRTTDSRLTLVKKKGSWFKTFLALHVMLIDPVAGMAMLASTSLGGQKIYSHNVVDQTMAYDQDGQVDKDKTKTSTLEENSYMQGKNFGDKVMMACDIMVAVAAVVAAIILAIIPGTQLLAAACIAAAVGLYRTMRQGVSTHDLGLFGKQSDRDEAKQNRVAFYSNVASTVTSVMGGGWVGGLVNAGFQMGIAQAGGADSKTTMLVGVLAFAGGCLSSGGGGLTTYIANAISTIGATVGTQKQQTTYSVISGLAAGGISGAVTAYLGALYSKSNSGTGLNERERARRQMVVAQTVSLGGSLISSFSNGFEDGNKSISGVKKTEVLLQGLRNVLSPISGLYNEVKKLFQGNSPIGDRGFGESLINGLTGLGGAIQTVFDSALDLLASPKMLALSIKARTNKNTPALTSKSANEPVSLSVPVGARYDIVRMGNGPIEISGQTYTKGMFVFDGQTWNLEGEGQVLADDFDGFGMKNGQKIPVNVMTTEAGLTPLGIGWNDLEGKELITSKRVEIIGVGTLYAGGVRVEGGAPRFSVGSICQRIGSKYPVFIMEQEGKVLEQPVRMNGDRFTLEINRFKLGTGQTVNIENNDLGGEIKEGRVVFNRREGQVKIILNSETDQVPHSFLSGNSPQVDKENKVFPSPLGRGQGEGVERLLKTVKFHARGEALAKWTEIGLELTGYLDGDLMVDMARPSVPQARNVNAQLGNHEGRVLVAGDYTVESTKGSMAHLLGRVALTEQGVMPYSDGTQFKTAEKAVLWKNGVGYNSGQSEEKFIVVGGEVGPIPPGALAYLGDGRIRMGVEPMVVNRVGLEIKDEKDWGRAEAFEIREVLIQPDAQGRYQAEVWHEGQRLGLLKTKQSATTLAVLDHNGKSRAISLVPGESIDSTLSVNVSAWDALKTVGEGYLDKMRGQLGRFSALSAGLMESVNTKSLGVRIMVFGLLGATPVGSFVSPAAGLTGSVGTAFGKERIGQWATQMDQTITRGHYKITAHSSLLSNKDGLKPLQQASVAFVGGVVAPLGAMTDFMGVHSLKYYDEMKAQGRAMEAVTDDLKIGGKNALIGGLVGGAVSYFGKPALILVGVGFGTVTAIHSPASSWQGKVGEGLGASSLLFMSAATMKRNPMAGRPKLARLRVALKSGVISSVDNLVGGVGLVEHMRMSIVSGDRSAQLGVAGKKNLKVLGHLEGVVQVEINNDGGALPSLAELKDLTQRAHDQKLMVEVTFGNRQSMRAFKKNPELMSLVGPEGLNNLKVIGKYEVKLSERHRERLLEQKDYQVALKGKKEAAVLAVDKLFVANEAEINVWTDRNKAVKEAMVKLKESFTKGEVSADELVGEIKEHVPGWEPGKELMGKLRRAQADIRGVEGSGEGLAQGAGDAAGRVGFLQRLSNRFKELVQGNRRKVRQAGGAGQEDGGISGAIERGLAAERLANRAEQLANRAVGFVEDKISILRTENERLVNRRSGLQDEIRVAGDRAGFYQKRADKVGKRIEGLLQDLNSVEERIVNWDSRVFQNEVGPSLRLTPEWKTGARLSLGALLSDWREDVSGGLDPAYAPYPFNFNNPPRMGNIFDSIVESRAPPELIGELLNVLGEGDGRVRLVSVRSSAEMAEGFVKTATVERPSGVVGERLTKDARHGQAVYLTQRVGTGIKELEFHQRVGTHYNEYDVDFNKARVLDLTDPRVVGRFKPEYGDDYKLTAKSAQQARMAGYDVVMYESKRDSGALNFAVIERHNDLLKVDPTVHSVDPADRTPTTAVSHPNVPTPSTVHPHPTPPLQLEPPTRAGPQALKNQNNLDIPSGRVALPASVSGSGIKLESGYSPADYVVSFGGSRLLKHMDKSSALLGPKGGVVWVMPLEDASRLMRRSDVVTQTGHAPSVLRSYLEGSEVYGVAVPSNKVRIRMPTKEDSGGYRHWRSGGHTGVEHNGNWRQNMTQERVIEGGNQIPSGSILFKFNSDGTWTEIRRF